MDRGVEKQRERGVEMGGEDPSRIPGKDSRVVAHFDPPCFARQSIRRRIRKGGLHEDNYRAHPPRRPVLSVERGDHFICGDRNLGETLDDSLESLGEGDVPRYFN